MLFVNTFTEVSQVHNDKLETEFHELYFTLFYEFNLNLTKWIPGLGTSSFSLMIINQIILII